MLKFLSNVYKKSIGNSWFYVILSNGLFERIK